MIKYYIIFILFFLGIDIGFPYQDGFILSSDRNQVFIIMTESSSGDHRTVSQIGFSYLFLGNSRVLVQINSSEIVSSSQYLYIFQYIISTTTLHILPVNSRENTLTEPTINTGPRGPILVSTSSSRYISSFRGY